MPVTWFTSISTSPPPRQAWYGDGRGEAEHGRAAGDAEEHPVAGPVEGTEAVSGYAVIIEQGETSFGA
jgi:hypothetical protein